MENAENQENKYLVMDSAVATNSLVDSAAPRDFQVSVSTESGRYSRCMLCAAGRRIFHCAECIASGNFVHSSAPYSERFADKQLKLYRIRANRKYVMERCESLLVGRNKQERLRIEANQCKERIMLLKLAIEQANKSVQEKRLHVTALIKYNAELKGKLPRYEKRVAALERHTITRQNEVQSKESTHAASVDRLAALRRARLRQLTKYVFPVRLTYDAQDSLDSSDELLQDVRIIEQRDKMRHVHLHIASTWLPANGDYCHYIQWVKEHKDNGASAVEQPTGPEHPVHRTGAGLALVAQLTSLTAFYLAVRLPYALSFSDYSGLMSEATLKSRVRRLFACLVWLGLHARQPPPPDHRHTVTLLHALCTAAVTDDAHLGRVGGGCSSAMASAAEAWSAAWAAGDELSDEDEPPEHLSWDTAAEWDATAEMSTVSASPQQPMTASIVTSAAASLASIWRGWTK